MRLLLDETVLLSAVRYALGRRSYIVSETVMEVVRVWGQLSAGTQECIVRDVREHLLSLDDLTDIDSVEWRSLLRWCGQDV